VPISAQASAVVFLENDTLKVGVLIAAGGRIVYFSLKGQDNVLKEDRSLWDDPESHSPGFNAESDYKPYHGNEVWVSPMADWWQQQDLYPDRKKNKKRWPPDPYLIYGKSEIISQTKEALSWRGMKSPVSGVQITQHLKFIDEKSIEIIAEVKNIRQTAISWGIWMNTRVDGTCQCYVPVQKEDPYQKFSDAGSGQHNIPWQIENGYFSFLPNRVSAPRADFKTKAYLNPSDSYIAALSNKQLFVIEYDSVAKDRLPPGHAHVEIYNQIMPKAVDNLLELEVHSAYQEIAAGESIRVRQRWSLYDCPNGIDSQSLQLKMSGRKKDTQAVGK
jgi:hypothetical protein